MQQSATSGEGQWRRLLKTMFTPLVVHQMEVVAQLTAQQHRGLLKVEQLIVLELQRNNSFNIIPRNPSSIGTRVELLRNITTYGISSDLPYFLQVLTNQTFFLVSSDTRHLTHTLSRSLTQRLTFRPSSTPLSASITITWESSVSPSLSPNI